MFRCCHMYKLNQVKNTFGSFPHPKKQKKPKRTRIEKKNNEEQKQKIQQTNSIYNDIQDSPFILKDTFSPNVNFKEDEGED